MLVNIIIFLPMECSHALFLVIDIFSAVFPAIRPLEDALPLHLVVLPFSFVLTAVGPVVDA